MDTKTCNKCRLSKAVTEFYKRSRAKDGLQYHCKACVKVYKAHNHSDSVYYHRNKNKFDQELRRVYMRQYYQARLEARREYGRKYYAAHREEYEARWRQRLTDGSYLTVARRDAVAKRRAVLASAFVEDVDREVVWQRDEGCCRMCDVFVSLDEMHLDHVVPLSKGGVHAYSNVQASCAPCNLKKGAG